MQSGEKRSGNIRRIRKTVSSFLPWPREPEPAEFYARRSRLYVNSRLPHFYPLVRVHVPFIIAINIRSPFCVPNKRKSIPPRMILSRCLSHRDLVRLNELAQRGTMSEKRRTWASIARPTSFQSDSDDERRILSRAILDRRQRIGECEEATRHVATRYSRKIGIRRANRAPRLVLTV